MGLIAFNETFMCFQHYPDIWVHQTYLWAAYLTGIYFNIYVLSPRLLLKKKYMLYGLTLSASVFLMVAVRDWIKMQYILQTYNYVTLLDAASDFALYMICVGGVSITRLLPLWIDDGKLISRLESEHAKSEMDRMKEQINPQFLFNILTYTSELTWTDVRKTSEMLFKLSQLLRYELYDCNREEVLLSSDIQFVDNYLELEQLYAGNFEYTLSVTGNTNSRFVPPLLFIPFVQQALNQIRFQNVSSVLHLSFQIDPAGICFVCSADKVNLDCPGFSGNRQRLDLSYPDGYVLSEAKDRIELQLNIPNHAE
jgi:hypothetical protein